MSRETLYGTPSDAQMPRNLQADAKVPFLGFCGPGYRVGGCALLAINPGGGGDAYKTRTPQDEELIPLIEAFVSASGDGVAGKFRDMCQSYSAQVQTWNLWRILEPTIQACGSTVDEICYLNCFPYRTATDALPHTRARRQAWESIVNPLLSELRPSKLIALGKKVGNVAVQFHSEPPPRDIVPRTIGDSYVSAEAEKVLAEIQNASQPAQASDV